ncbi:MAG: ABC transporter permease [Hydrogenovibrio sp.]|uniref:ABC transporter permease n=1 Tax=Hydrogenovibrio sp. TaxID=2065821 RepID=UPI00286FF652|nr:ABC transporter permease [Hydrogenovibrio sp.]MDR9498765.1 ABC transporter permease [Hydrogenovibrio sp.]
MNFLTLSLKSAWHRKTPLLLAALSVAISFALLFGVDTVRKQAKDNFLNTVSQTDLIVGARTGPVNLLLYSVFHLGQPTNNMGYDTYRFLQKHPQTQWAIPLSLGDSHRGFRVIGTQGHFFDHYRHAQGQPLVFERGERFNDLYEVVIGAQVAAELNYQPGDRLLLSHGVAARAEASLPEHDDKPFRVSGILAPTGTPLDRSLQVSLRALEAIHLDWQSGRPSPLKLSPELARKLVPEPTEITAVMVGLTDRIQTFRLQRQINAYQPEPIMAILPGATLARFWQSLRHFEQAFMLLSWGVFVAALTGILISLLNNLHQRRHEIALLRAIGMHRRGILSLFWLDTLLIMLGGFILGIGLLQAGLWLLQPWLLSHYGLSIGFFLPDADQLKMALIALGAALLISTLPGWLAARNNLKKGLQP